MKSSNKNIIRWFGRFGRMFLNAFLVASLTAIFACGGGGGGGAEVGVDQSGSSAVYARFAYVANESDDTVSIYTVDASTGQLRANGYVTAGDSPNFVTVDPSGKFAYVANAGTDNVSAYTINAATGALSQI